GGTACPTPAVSKMLPMANPRARFMLPSPFPAALARPARTHGVLLCRFSAAGRSLRDRANPGPVTRLRAAGLQSGVRRMPRRIPRARALPPALASTAANPGRQRRNHTAGRPAGADEGRTRPPVRPRHPWRATSGLAHGRGGTPGLLGGARFRLLPDDDDFLTVHLDGASVGRRLAPRPRCTIPAPPPHPLPPALHDP